MPNQHRPGPRFELSEEALDFLVSTNPRYLWGPSGKPNITRIAEVGGSATRSTMRKIFKRDLPVSLEALAGMVKASGARTDKQVWNAVQRLLVYVPDDEQAENDSTRVAA